MQTEIEQLMLAWLKEQRRDEELMRNMFSAIAVASAGRRRMIEDLATAISGGNPSKDEAVKTNPQPDEHLTQAVHHFRSAR